jgi:hypothetical protein
MVKLTIKENTFKIKRILAFGCSFTAGTEILDHQLNPYFVDLKNKLDAYQWWEKLKKDPDQMKLQLEIRKQEPNHSWPAHLASYLGVNFVNYAKPGNSNEFMCWQIEQKLDSGEITDDDLILVGTTGTQRSMFFSNTHPDPVPFLLSNTESYKVELSEHITKYFTDDRLLWNYYRDLKVFESIKQKINGRLFVIPMEHVRQELCLWPSTHAYGTYRVVSLENALFFNKIINQLHNSQLFATTDCCLYDFKTEKTTLPHGHLNEDAHRSFAEQLYKEHVALE